MTVNELKPKLQQPYSRDTWLQIAKGVFKNISVLNQPLDIDYKKPFVKAFRQLGNVHLEDGRSLAMIEVKVDDTKDLYKNKVELRNLTTKLIDEETSHGVLVIYDNESGNYRFTFAAKESVLNEAGQVETKETHPKRYTYLLGPGESCFTPAIQLSKLSEKGGHTNLEDVTDAFNVEAVNKKFFNDYKQHYSAFVEYLAASNFKRSVFNGDEKAIRDFVKKLLGRIVFLYFVQKKGWLGVPADSNKWEEGNPHFLRELFETSGKGKDFYPVWLSALFFDALNKQRRGDLFEMPDGSKAKVPYLNGGLFECDNENFNLLTFQPALFADLFEFFDQYNFTIYEDDPEERFLAVDPEMLGHIFENLLEDNKDKGAYYTPKEIVHYMCQESLIEYLCTKVSEKHSESAEVCRPKLEKLVKQKLGSDLGDYEETLLQALRDVKICDPAIGSGAFPMGLLHEIFDIVQLFYTVSPDVTKDIWKMGKEWNPAKVKEDIIQNSIYGVDIEKGAVEIARLRFWLSLLIDEEEPRPLPNLDYKIVVGDSLLSKFDGEVVDIEWNYTTSHGTAETKRLITEQVMNLQTLQAWQEQFFKLVTGNKQKLQLDIRNKKIDILTNQLRLSRISYQQKNPRLGGYAPTAKEIKKNLENELVQRGYDQKIHKLHALRADKNAQLHFFDWKLDFPEVMNEKVVKGEAGFDIVIGNPPYVQLQKMGKDADCLASAGYKTFTRTADIYCLFYELGNRLLKQGGNLVFITSNSWLRANYGKQLRNFLRSEANPLLLIDLSDSDIFQSATVRTNILQFAKQLNQNALKALRLTRKSAQFLPVLSEYFASKHSLVKVLTDNAWVISDGRKSAIQEKVQLVGKPLKQWNVEIFRGILTGYNEAFVIDEEIKKQLIQEDKASAELIKPLLRGRDLYRYGFDFGNLYLINSHNGIKEKNIPPINVKKDYPAIYNHLKQFNPQLEKRLDKGDNWFNLRNCAYLEAFEIPKIIYPNMVTEIGFAYDVDGYFTNQKCFILTGEKLKYLVGVLNSQLFRYCFEDTFPELQGNAREINKVILIEIPIKYPTAQEENQISSRVEKILTLKDTGKKTMRLEREIDALVYQVHGLDFDEACLVEGNAEWMSREEYEQIQTEADAATIG